MRGSLAKFRVLFVRLAVSLSCLLVACRPTHGSKNSPADEQPDVASAALDVGKQKYIWDIEHAAFELEKKFGATFLSALGKRDAAALRDFCLPDFTATILDPAQRTSISRGSIRQVGAKTEMGKESAADSAQLFAHLCAYFDDFKEIGNLKLRVLDLHADDRSPETGNWTATIYLTGVGIDRQGAPIEFVSQHRLRFHFADDAAIVAGRIVSQWRVQSEKFRYSQGPLFEEVTAAVGLDKVDIRDNWNSPTDSVRQYFSQMAVEDFDRDGFFDLVIASADGRWRLLKSLAGKEFKEVGSQIGIPYSADEEPRSQSIPDQAFIATWIDFDNDGFPDLLLGDRLFRNFGGVRFEDVTDMSGLLFEFNPKGCVVADYDCDGLTDLYVLYQNKRSRENSGPIGWVGDNHSGAENHLWKNLGNGRFKNTTETSGAGGGARQTFAAAWLYVNDDHYPDLYIANDFGNNVLLLNQGNGHFRDVSDAAGVSNYANSMGVATGDLTGDGYPEIYVANMFSKMGRRIIAHVDSSDYPPGVFEQIQGSCAGNRLFTPLRDGGKNPAKYREISEDIGVNQVGWAYAPALADFDSDGFLDIYATAGFLSFQRSKPDG